MGITVTVLGKDLGSASDWDSLSEVEFMFYGVLLNSIGRSFLPHFEDGHDLAINFETGEVTQYDPNPDDGGNGNPVSLKPDWSVFNS